MDKRAASILRGSFVRVARYNASEIRSDCGNHTWPLHCGNRSFVGVVEEIRSPLPATQRSGNIPFFYIKSVLVTPIGDPSSRSVWVPRECVSVAYNSLHHLLAAEPAAASSGVGRAAEGMLPETPDKEKSSDESLPATDLSVTVRGHEGISPPIAHAKSPLPVCYSATVLPV